MPERSHEPETTITPRGNDDRQVPPPRKFLQFGKGDRVRRRTDGRVGTVVDTREGFAPSVHVEFDGATPPIRLVHSPDWLEPVVDQLAMEVQA